MENASSTPQFLLWRSAARDVWDLQLLGNWRDTDNDLPVAESFIREHLQSLKKARIIVTAKQLESWDSRLQAFLFLLAEFCKNRQWKLDWSSLPEPIIAPLKLVELTPTAPIQRKIASTFCQRLKVRSEQFCRGFCQGMAFIGDVALGIGRTLRGKSYGRTEDYGELFRQVGAEALPIVALISFLTGIILGFIGVIQLARFGAAIYVADLVGIAMTREMGAIMTGVIMAGRTGAAFAATIGTMKVNEELDALKTLGISTIDFLVLPRMFALACMMPLLTIFSIFIGIGGGMAIAVPMFDFGFLQYINETLGAITLNDFLIGVFKGCVFALLVSGLGCLRGLQCERSAAAVGEATTSAVVSGITAIIIADAIFAFIFNILHI